MDNGSSEHDETIRKNEEIIDFTNSTLTQFLIKLAANMEESDENTIGSYFHVLGDLERIGDHAENFHEIGVEMLGKKLAFSEKAQGGICAMRENVMQMFVITKNAFENLDKEQLPALNVLENNVDGMKKDMIASHFARLAEGNCSVDVSPYYSSVIVGLERVADHLVNVAYSIDNPIGSQITE
jgi:phosphate:Na+ symporter